MYDPIMRVLTVLEILQAREHVSGAELAKRLEVNPRTVQRYIARLQDLCIPGFTWLRAGEPGAVRRNVVDAWLFHCGAATTRVASGIRPPRSPGG